MRTHARPARDLLKVSQAGARIVALDKLGLGSYGTTGELLYWEYTDRATLSSTTTAYDLFMNPAGQGGKTAGDTNVVSTGQIPQGQHFTVKALHLEYNAVGAAITTTSDILAIAAWLDGAVMEVSINNKYPILQVPLSRVLGTSFMSATDLASGSGVNTQFGIFNGKFSLAGRDIVLAALTSYKVHINVITPSLASRNGDTFRISLAGDLIRAI